MGFVLVLQQLVNGCVLTVEPVLMFSGSEPKRLFRCFPYGLTDLFPFDCERIQVSVWLYRTRNVLQFFLDTLLQFMLCFWLFGCLYVKFLGSALLTSHEEGPRKGGLNKVCSYHTAVGYRTHPGLSSAGETRNVHINIDLLPGIFGLYSTTIPIVLPGVLPSLQPNWQGTRLTLPPSAKQISRRRLHHGNWRGLHLLLEGSSGIFSSSSWCWFCDSHPASEQTARNSSCSQRKNNDTPHTSSQEPISHSHRCLCPDSPR